MSSSSHVARWGVEPLGRGGAEQGLIPSQVSCPLPQETEVSKARIQIALETQTLDQEAEVQVFSV